MFIVDKKYLQSRRQDSKLSKHTVDPTSFFDPPGDWTFKYMKFRCLDNNSAFASRLAFADQQRRLEEGSGFAGESSGTER
jgi:hypothetical protein